MILGHKSDISRYSKTQDSTPQCMETLTEQNDDGPGNFRVNLFQIRTTVTGGKILPQYVHILYIRRIDTCVYGQVDISKHMMLRSSGKPYFMDGISRTRAFTVAILVRTTHEHSKSTYHSMKH